MSKSSLSLPSEELFSEFEVRLLLELSETWLPLLDCLLLGVSLVSLSLGFTGKPTCQVSTPSVSAVWSRFLDPSPSGKDVVFGWFPLREFQLIQQNDQNALTILMKSHEYSIISGEMSFFAANHRLLSTACPLVFLTTPSLTRGWACMRVRCWLRTCSMEEGSPDVRRHQAPVLWKIPWGIMRIHRFLSQISKLSSTEQHFFHRLWQKSTWHHDIARRSIKSTNFTSPWKPKQFFNACLVKQPFPKEQVWNHPIETTILIRGCFGYQAIITINEILLLLPPASCRFREVVPPTWRLCIWEAVTTVRHTWIISSECPSKRVYMRCVKSSYWYYMILQYQLRVYMSWWAMFRLAKKNNAVFYNIWAVCDCLLSRNYLFGLFLPHSLLALADLCPPYLPSCHLAISSTKHLVSQ